MMKDGVEVLTVGELRKLLDGVADDLQVGVHFKEGTSLFRGDPIEVTWGSDGIEERDGVKFFILNRYGC